MRKDEMINFLFYLLDKVDEVYYREVKINIERFINNIDDYIIFKK